MLAILTEYAYIGIPLLIIGTAVGLPLPEDILVIASGILAERNHIPLAYAWGSCYVAILIADSITMYLGWHFGKAILHRRWIKRIIHPKRVRWARRQVHEHGAWVILAARFIPGLRFPVMLISGMMHLKRWKFLLADSVGLLLSVSIQITIGWFVSKSIDKFLENRNTILIAVAGLGVAIIFAYIIFRWLRFRKRVSQTST